MKSDAIKIKNIAIDLEAKYKDMKLCVSVERKNVKPGAVLGRGDTFIIKDAIDVKCWDNGRNQPQLRAPFLKFLGEGRFSYNSGVTYGNQGNPKLRALKSDANFLKWFTANVLAAVMA